MESRNCSRKHIQEEIKAFAILCDTLPKCQNNFHKTEGLTKMMDTYRRHNSKGPIVVWKELVPTLPPLHVTRKNLCQMGFQLTSMVQFSSLDYFISNNMFYYSIAIHPKHQSSESSMKTSPRLSLPTFLQYFLKRDHMLFSNSMKFSKYAFIRDWNKL